MTVEIISWPNLSERYVAGPRIEPRNLLTTSHWSVGPGNVALGLKLPLVLKSIWAASWQNQYNGTCPQRRTKSAQRRPRSAQILLSAWRILGSLATHWVHSEGWSDWADAQADLCLRWAHSHFVVLTTSVTSMTVHQDEGWMIVKALYNQAFWTLLKQSHVKRDSKPQPHDPQSEVPTTRPAPNRWKSLYIM